VLAWLNHSVWLVVDVRIIAVKHKSSSLVSPSLVSGSTFSSPATIAGGTTISTLATALAPTARIISHR
jgi:hypothetical protein